MNLKEMTAEFNDLSDAMKISGERSFYLGSAMGLDPCGRYHHAISPNNPTTECSLYWKRLYKAAEAAGGWIESGESDPTDIYFCIEGEEDLYEIEEEEEEKGP